MSPLAMHIVVWARKQGFVVPEALQEVGLSTERFAGQPRRVPLVAVEQLLEALSRRIPGELFALRSGADAPTTLLPLLGPMMAASPTLEDAFDELGTYYAAMSDHFHVRVSRTASVLEVTGTWRVESELVVRHGSESVAAHWVAFARAICLETPPVVRVRLPFARGSAGAQRARREYFGVTPTHEPGTALQLAWSRGGDTRLNTQDAVLVSLLRTPLEKEATGEGLRARVERALLAAEKPATLGVEAMAGELGVSARTLTRQLAADGTSFGELSRATLERRAKERLARPGAQVRAVARELGYASRGSFDRAFARWTGATPARWVAAQSATDAGSD
ncbi:MAG: AraC family transcriptional regulator ligand-binding domain-containing protein [Myxococcota bacterium]